MVDIHLINMSEAVKHRKNDIKLTLCHLILLRLLVFSVVIPYDSTVQIFDVSNHFGLFIFDVVQNHEIYFYQIVNIMRLCLALHSLYEP